eukprot:15467621-Alexandrium_andersonii.AAC.1
MLGVSAPTWRRTCLSLFPSVALSGSPPVSLAAYGPILGNMASGLPPPPPPWNCQGSPRACFSPKRVGLQPNPPIRYAIAEPPPAPPFHLDGVRVPVPPAPPTPLWIVDTPNKVSLKPSCNKVTLKAAPESPLALPGPDESEDLPPGRPRPAKGAVKSQSPHFPYVFCESCGYGSRYSDMSA